MESLWRSNGTSQYLIDGFPRNVDNLDGWSRIMGPVPALPSSATRPYAIVPFVLFLECTEDIMLQRCLDRGKTSGRSDDNKESLVKR